MACQESKIPVLTVTKNGTVLKNIFIQPSPSSTPIAAVEDGNDKEKEETLTIGRHPDCNIVLTHPSVSRFHLRIDLNPFSQKLFVTDLNSVLMHPSISRFHHRIDLNPFSRKRFITDLNSVHGTWVRDEKIEPRVRVELNEGDTLRVGISTRLYRLHWVSRDRAFDLENPSLPAMDLAVSNGALEEENDVEMSQEEVFVESNNIVADGNDSSLGTGNKEETSQILQDVDTNLDDDNQSHLSDSIWEAVVSLFSGECCYGNIGENQIVSSSLVTEENEFPANQLGSDGKEDAGYCDWTFPSIENNEKLAIKEVEACLITEALEETRCLSSIRADIAKTDNTTVPTVENIENPTIKEEVKTYLITETLEETKCLSSLSEDSEKTDNYTLQEDLDHSFVVVDLLENNNGRVEEEKQIVKGADEVHQIVPSIENIVNSMITEEVQACLTTETLEEAKSMISFSEDSEKTDNVKIKEESDILEINIGNTKEEGQTLEKVDDMLPMFQEENLMNSRKCLLNALESPHVECLDDRMVTNFLVGEQKSSPSRDYNRQTESEGGFFFASLATELFEETEYQSKKTDNVTLAVESDIPQTNFGNVKEEGQTLEVVDDMLSIFEDENLMNSSKCSVSALESPHGECLDDQIVTDFLVEEEKSSPSRDYNGQTESEGGFFASLATESFEETGCHSEKTDNVTLKVEPDILETNIGNMKEEGQTLEVVDDMLPLFQEEKLMNSSKCLVNALERPDVECLDDRMVTDFLVEEEKSSLSRDYNGQTESEGSFFFASLATEVSEETGFQSSSSKSTDDSGNFSGVAEIDQVKEENQTQQLVDLHTTYPEENLETCTASSSLDMLTRLNVDDLSNQMITTLLDKEETSELPREGHRQTDSQSSRSLSLATETENLSSPVEEVKSEGVPDIESVTPRSVHLTSNSSNNIKVSQIISEKKINTPNIRSRRGKLASVLDLQINSGSEVLLKVQEQISKPVFSCSRVPEELLTPDKENCSPNTFHSKCSRTERVPLLSISSNSLGKNISSASLRVAVLRSNSSSKHNSLQKKINFPSTDKQKTWTMIVDTPSLLDSKSRKALQLLQGLKCTQLIIPLTVLRELVDLKFRGGLFRSNTEASLSLEWIEECSLQTYWWIHLESSMEEEDRLAAPLLHTNTLEKSPNSEDQLLHYALHYRKMHTERQLIFLSNAVTMKIKAMAEGIICEKAHEFRDSLVNPFSERFLWTKSSPRGLNWSVSDDVVLKETFYSRQSKKFSDGEGAKGLKLILRQDSGNGMRQPLNAFSIFTGILLQAPLW